MDDKFPFKLATGARACGFHVNRGDWSIDKLPLRGATASLEVDDNGSRHTASRVAVGVAAGVVFLPLALIGLTKKRNVQIYVTVHTSAGKTTKIVPGSRHQMALDFVNQFNALSQQISEQVPSM
jgi:hypothetical protein